MFGKPVVRRRAQGHCGPAMANGSDRTEGDQRSAIIRAAALAFSRRGFAATKIDDVAEELGSTKGLVYYHFRSKGDLFLAVHHDALCMDLDTIAPLAATGLAPDRKLRRMLVAHTMLVIDHNPIHRVVVQGVELHLAGATTPSQRRMLDRIIGLRDEYQALFLKVIEDGVAAGCLHAEEPRLAVKVLLGAVNWMTMWYKPDPAQTDEQRADLARKVADLAAGTLSGLAKG